jgi:HEAT repeat protein
MIPAGGEDDLLHDLVAEATREEEDEEAYWRSVSRLQRGEAERVWGLLEPLVDHPDPRVRTIVPDVLRFLGGPKRPLSDRTVELFRRMLLREQPPSVLSAIGCALGELGHVTSVELMAPFASHPDPAVRSAVVASLLRQRDPVAIETLIMLSRDERDDVRDWATFGLGSQVGPTDFDRANDDDVVDTPALRDALAARLDDPHVDTRCAAIVGLAMRRDPRVLPLLTEEIASGPRHSLVLEAARWMASPELCAGLRKLAASNDPDDVAFWTANGLREAIEACCWSSQ